MDPFSWCAKFLPKLCLQLSKLCGCNTPYFGFTTQVFGLFQGREDIVKVSLYAKNIVCVTSVSVVTQVTKGLGTRLVTQVTNVIDTAMYLRLVCSFVCLRAQ